METWDTYISYSLQLKMDPKLSFANKTIIKSHDTKSVRLVIDSTPFWKLHTKQYYAYFHSDTSY
jgi:hypothetical protein